MPFLDWGEKPVSLAVSHQSAQQTEVVLGLSQELLAELLQELIDLYAGDEGGATRELRLVLPQNWVLFWKSRGEGARLLVAHPASQEWVGTLALSIEWANRLLRVLKELPVGKTVALGQLSGVHGVSNLGLTIRLMEQGERGLEGG